MKHTLFVTGGANALALMLVLSFASAGNSANAPAASQPKAKFITSAKCGMCHKPVATAWQTTVHAKNSKQLPWEAEKQDVPAPDVVYRYTTGYDAAAKTWSEKGTTCEACHGAGGNHFMASKDQRKTTITNPANLDTAAKKVSLCGRCHGQYSINGQRFAADFQPGQDLLSAQGITLDEVQPGKPMQEMNELVKSKHFAQGVACTTCHSSHPTAATEHSLKQPVVALCTSCHKDKTMADHAPTAAADATCATCHMPDGSHAFVKPAK